MKLAVLCLCMLHLASVSGRIFPQDNRQNRNLSKTPQRTGLLNQGRQRTLFARRGQYEQQKIHVMRPKVNPVPQRNPPITKAEPKPTLPICSLLGQSCTPASGCCEPCGTCHCHFFNAICFCLRTNSQCKKKKI